MSQQESIKETVPGIKRRSVLQAAGVAAGAATVGVSAFSGSVAAQDNFQLHFLTPSTQVYSGEATQEYTTAAEWRVAFTNYGIENQHLVSLGGVPPDVGEIQDVQPLNPTNVAGDTREQVVQAATLARRPDGLIWGIANQNYGPVDGLARTDAETGKGRYVFTIDPSDGDLTLVGSANDELRYLWGSTWNSDGSTLYALQSDAAPGTDEEKLFTVEVSEFSTTVTELGSVSDIIGDRQGDNVVHTGLSWNELAPEFNIVGVLGNFSGEETKDDLVEIDPTGDLRANVAAENVFESGELVATGFNPCVGGEINPKVYSIRNGNEVYSADIDEGAVTGASQLATLDGDSHTPNPLIVTDNLAEDPADCPVACTRTIGYWKNHPGCESGPGNGKGKSNKTTIESVLRGEDGACGGFSVGTDPVYDGTDPANPEGIYDFRGDDDPCSADEENETQPDVDLIVAALEGAKAKDMDGQLLAQLLGAKLNVCNGSTRADGTGGDIMDTINAVDEYFSAITDPTDPSENTVGRDQKETWKDILDGYNNQNVALACEEEEEE